MDTKKIAGIGAGLLALGAGVWYFFFRNGAQAQCSEGEQKCLGADLYTCTNGSWVLTEENSAACVSNGGREPIDIDWR